MTAARGRTAAAGLAALACAVLAACSTSSSDPVTVASPATPTSTGIAVGGAFSGNVDGTSIDVPDAGVACRAQGSSTTLTVTSQSGTAGASASVVLDHEGKVLLVDIVSAPTGPVSYADGFNVGSAVAEEAGATWTVRGEATTSTDASPAPEAPTTPFELTITCP